MAESGWLGFDKVVADGEQKTPDNLNASLAREFI
jgi:hypothetical protein